MAVDWIKMRVDLQTHPKVRRMASVLQTDKFRTIGGLHAVWSLFDAHSVDGTLAHYSPADLDAETGFPGIARAMEVVGWLTVTADQLSLPEFDEHNGQSAKRRAEDQKRKRNDRRVRNWSDADTDTKRTREEKRREEKTVNQVSPQAGDASNATPGERNGARVGGETRQQRVEIPEDFEPSPEERKWAREAEGLSEADIDQETSRFIRHHRAKGSRFKRPELAWKNWITGRFIGRRNPIADNSRSADGAGLGRFKPRSATDALRRSGTN